MFLTYYKRNASTCLLAPGDPSRLGTPIYVVRVGTWRMRVNVYYTYVVVSVVSVETRIIYIYIYIVP